MSNTYKTTDKLLEDYNYLSQGRKNKLDRYLKNLYRLEQAERRISWADTEIKREMQKIGLVPDRLLPDECYCSFCGKPSADVKKMIAAQNDVFICDECVALCSDILEEECKEASAPASSDTEQ